MLKRTLYSGAGLLAIALAFLAFNILSGLLFSQSRLDLTEQKLYSLSEGTQRILKELKTPLELEFFFSDELARELPAVRLYAQRVQELLNSYARLAPEYIRLKVTDPKPFSGEEDRAAELGLQGAPLQQGGDSLYFGLSGRVKAEEGAQALSEAIPFFQQSREELLEYEISRLIQNLANPERPVLGLLSTLSMEGGFDMRTQQPTGPWMLLEEIRQRFRIQALPPQIEQIPAEVSVLMLVHPKALPESTLYAIDQFVLRGGKLLAFVDPYSEADDDMGLPGLPGLEPESPSHASSMPALFKAWGLRLIPEQVVADPSYALSVAVDEQSRPVRHPAWLSMPAQTLNQQDVISTELENLTLATAGALEPLAGASTRFTPLLQSSNAALLLDAQRFVGLENPKGLLRGLQAEGKTYTLAARLQGSAQSAFPNGIEGHKDGLTSASAINLIVMADTDVLTDRLWVQVQDFFGQSVPHPWADNASWVINALDNLSGSDALISVRSRGRYSRPFTRVQALQRTAEAQFLEQEERLQQRLTETERQLAELQNDEPGHALEMSPEQQRTLQQFLHEKLAIRKELREVRYQLNADIEALGTRLRLVNILLMPVLLTLGVLVWLWQRRRKTAAIKYAR